MFLNIRIDCIILKTYNQQFTLTTKKSLHIIFNILSGSVKVCWTYLEKLIVSNYIVRCLHDSEQQY